MNSLLFFQNEIVRQFLPGEVCELRLSGARAAYVRQWHSLSEGKEFPALLHQYGRGRASVATLSEQEICFTGRFEPLEIERLKVLAIVGVSRPQTVKKVIHSAVTFGVEELVLVGTERGEKSYLQSHSLAPDQILEETVRALEQATDPHPPAISLLKHFGELRSRLTLFCEHGGRSACKYVLDPGKDGESGGGQGRIAP
ncbi:MAG: 16S rRNA (uracil(1498)-N(3))-methyltransferase, partial [Bdellovibrionales bacterium]|nr:16S rRNA (uracil(1498)-N(3))-methyltransferase [Bdellovibrionales bacterium]